MSLSVLFQDRSFNLGEMAIQQIEVFLLDADVKDLWKIEGKHKLFQEHNTSMIWSQ